MRDCTLASPTLEKVSGYSTGSGLLVLNIKKRIIVFNNSIITVLSCYLNQLSRIFSTTVRGVLVSALELYALGSGFKDQRSHCFIVMKCSIYLFRNS